MAWYKNGTVAVTNGSNIITGTGTDFVSNVQIGQVFMGPDGRAYEIVAVDTATQFRIAGVFYGGSGSGVGYSIQPTSSFARDLAVQVATLINSFASVRDGIGQGLIADGTAAAPGIRFSADQDTGIARLGGNILGLIVGGATAAFVCTKGVNATAVNGYSFGFNIDGERITPTGGNEIARYGMSMSPFAGEFGVGLSAFGPLNFFTAGSHRWRIDANGHFQPAADAAVSIGSTATRVNVIYAASGTINTSDERSKKWRGDLSEAELAAADEIGSIIGVYQNLDAISAKGADEARLHVGVQAQAVAAVLTAHGLDAMRYGIVCYDEWPDIAAPVEQRDADGNPIRPATPPPSAQVAGDRYGIRYDELSMFLLRAERQRRDLLTAAVTTQASQISQLMARLDAMHA